jgi:hypothetical protein
MYVDAPHNPLPFPRPGTTLRLSDYDGATNGGTYYTLVIASYYTSCGPGRAEAPKYSKESEDLVAAFPGAKIAFLARCVCECSGVGEMETK